MLATRIKRVKQIISQYSKLFLDYERDTLEELLELLEKKQELTVNNWVEVSKFEKDDFLGTNFPEEIILRNDIISLQRLERRKELKCDLKGRVLLSFERSSTRETELFISFSLITTV